MTGRKPAKENTRMIHVRLSDDLHRKLRVKTAELDTTIQDWVEGLVRKSLSGKSRRK